MSRRAYKRPGRKKRKPRKKLTAWDRRADLPNEEWLPFPLNCDYAVSNKGRAKRLTRAKNARVGAMLTQFISNSGYRYFTCVDCNGEKKKHYTHRAVALTFLGPPPRADDIVNHKNLDKLCNEVENLEFISLSENQKHARDEGAMVGKQKLVKSQVIEIKSKLDTHSDKQLANDYDVSPSTIRSIRTGKTWSEFYSDD